MPVCRREIELNRRLAPDVYLGVADLIGPDGVPCDHLVVMCRMPAKRLSSMICAGRPVDAELRRLARMLDSWPEAHTVVTNYVPDMWREAVVVTGRCLHPAGAPVG